MLQDPLQNHSIGALMSPHGNNLQVTPSTPDPTISDSTFVGTHINVTNSSGYAIKLIKAERRKIIYIGAAKG